MAIVFRDKREGYFFRETLSSVIRGLTDKYTVIDLRNEASVYGKITHVSGYMDVELEKAIFRNPRGDYYPCETFFVKSRNIRYVHIPEGYTAEQLIEISMQMNRKPVKKGKGKQVFKKKRAQTYQDEILRELQAKKT